jgi:UDP-glucose 4-epimerase
MATRRREHPVAVTGATGLVGRQVVKELEAQGHPVIAVGRHEPDGTGALLLRVDLLGPDAGTVLDELPILSGIVHCAAVLPAHDDDVDGRRSAEANKTIDQSVVTFASRRELPLVFTSSVAVYGQLEGQSIDEDAALHADGPYAKQKVATEALIRERVESAAILRISSPYGPAMVRATVLRLFLDRAFAGEPVEYFGSGARSQDFIHVNDLASACLLALDRPSSRGTFNVCSGTATTMRELAETCVRLAGHPGSVVRAAGRPDPLEGPTRMYDIRRAAEVLGWTPLVSLEDGIRDMVEHERQTLA